MTDYKVQLNRLRRMASRQGLRIDKVRRIDQLATDYGTVRVVDSTATVLFEHTDLNEVETYLTTPRGRR